MTQISQFFQYTDDSGNVLETARPHDMCDLSKVIDVVKGGKTGEKKAQAHINKRLWDLWDKYKTSLAEYDKEFAEIEAYNAENAENPEVTPKPYPTKPAWSDDDLPALTVTDVLNMPEVLAAKKEREKAKGVDVAGVLASLTAADQNGIGVVGVIALTKALVEQGVLAVNPAHEAALAAFDSVNFHFQNGNVQPLSLEINQYLDLALPFAATRQQYLD